MDESVRNDPHFQALKRKRIGVVLGGRSGEYAEGPFQKE